MPEVRIDVYAETHGAPQKINETERALDGLEKKSGTTDTAMGGLWKQVAAGDLIARATAKALDLLKDFVVDSFKAAIDAEEAESALNSALESTGRTVGPLSKHFKDYAWALQSETTYNDEAVMGAQTLLLQLTRLDQDGIDQATKGALGLASVFKMDLQSAARAVAQGMEGNYIMLGRMIPAIREAKTESEKHAAMVDGLSRFYSRAQAEGDTFSGTLKQLANTFDDVKETVGKAIINNTTYRETLDAINESAKRFASSGALGTWIDRVNKVLEPHLMGLRQWTLLLDLESVKAEKASRINEGLATSYDLITKTFKPMGPALKAMGLDFSHLIGLFKGAPKEINETGSAVRKMAEDDSKAKKEQEALAKSAQGILDKYNPLRAKMRDIVDEQKELTKAYKAHAITEGQYRTGMDRTEKELQSFGSTVVNTAIPAVRNLQGVVEKAVSKMQDGPGYITNSWAKNAKLWVEKNRESLDQIYSASSSVVGMIDGILQQSTNNKMIALDQEYQKRLENIENSKMSEEEKQTAITALEAEYDLKRRELQRKAAESGKVTAIAMAVINTAEGVTKALSALPPPFNIALAAITAAAGAIQIGLIKAQPIPLRKGGVLDRPTFSMDGRFVAGEAGPEVVAPLNEVPRLVREIMGRESGGRSFGGKIAQLHIHLDLGAEAFKDYVIDIVQERDRRGGLRLRQAFG
ncbi:MAG: hypothetical protein ACYDH3_00250 [Candidatus Aminicenantales bacterium]